MPRGPKGERRPAFIVKNNPKTMERTPRAFLKLQVGEAAPVEPGRIRVRRNRASARTIACPPE
jgi:hypothetical protein